jgi:hypothetical protein
MKFSCVWHQCLDYACLTLTPCMTTPPPLPPVLQLCLTWLDISPSPVRSRLPRRLQHNTTRNTTDYTRKDELLSYLLPNVDPLCVCPSPALCYHKDR